MELANLRKELEIVGAFMANVLIAELYAKGKVASGNLVDSVEFQIVEKDDRVVVDLLADRYIINVSEGRKAGYPSGGDGSFLKALIEWVKVKSIETEDKKVKAAAWAIREAIFKKGIPPTNIIPFVIEEIDKQVDAMIREAIFKDIKLHFDGVIDRLNR